ncbi:MAG: ISAzo13 family transposase [Acidobacteria bacterium]|nr:ISAzo13 family transposase [Acidobacteriota bacterium]MBI3644405.1 ISAzo13 family transposase [Terriglobales bacterium]
MAGKSEIAKRFRQLEPWLDEHMRRLWAAAESSALGRGGISLVARATGVSRRAIGVGRSELEQKPAKALPPKIAIRKPGGGRKKTLTKDPALLRDLEKLVEPVTRGDPESPLRWTCKSVRRLAEELRRKGHPVSHTLVAELLHQQKYSLQANRKTTEGSSHPDRNAQFEHINAKAEEFLKLGQPAISVDTKKKEQVGDYKNGGREWRPKGQPEPVRVHDFAKQKDVPYGVYDLGQDAGWVSVGTDHDTAAFAVESIRRWWNTMGQTSYPEARQLLITADGGGSNGSRVRLWKLELQRLADQTGLEISVCHFPPGTSKWNKIEHRLFSFITQNWRGKPLVSHEVIVNLIAATTTRTGLHVKSQLDTGTYPKGIKVSKAEFATIRLQPDAFHGDWNYSIARRT